MIRAYVYFCFTLSIVLYETLLFIRNRTQILSNFKKNVRSNCVVFWKLKKRLKQWLSNEKIIILFLIKPCWVYAVDKGLVFALLTTNVWKNRKKKKTCDSNFWLSILCSENMAVIEECKHVHDFNGTIAQCDFVQNNEHCNDTDGYFNYVEILYCDFGGTLAPLAIFIYALWLIVLFIGLGESADSYFCPNLAIISKTLRYSTVFKCYTSTENFRLTQNKIEPKNPNPKDGFTGNDFFLLWMLASTGFFCV